MRWRMAFRPAEHTHYTPLLQHSCFGTKILPGTKSLTTGAAPQVGTYEQDPEALARVLQRWIQHPNDELAELKANAARLGQQFAGGLFRIVRDLAALADQAGHAAAPAFLKYLPPGAFLDAAPALEATG